MDDFIVRLRKCFSWTSVGEREKSSVRYVVVPLGVTQQLACFLMYLVRKK
jgi:hypothetical protein